MANESRVVVQAFAPRIVAQSDAQELNFDDLIPQTKQIFRNLFTPIAGTDAEMILSLQHTGEKGISLKTRQTTLLTKPVLYITSWYRETNPETGLLETVHDNILKMGVIESTNNNENTVTKFTYIKSYGTLNMSNNPIENLSTPVNDTDAVNKSYVDTSINNIDYSSFVTNTGLSSTLNDYITNTSLATTLTDYSTNTSLATTLTNYVTNTSLTTTLADYPTNTSLATTLTDYPTNTSLATTLNDYATRAYAESLSANPTLGSYPIATIDAPLPIMFDISGASYANPQCFASPLSPFICVVPHYQQDKLLITIDGVNFREKTITGIFNTEATSSYNITGWFNTEQYRFYLLITNPTVKLVYTTDFETFQDVASQPTNSSLLTGQTLLTSCYMMTRGYAFIQTSSGLYGYTPSSNTFDQMSILQNWSSGSTTYSPDLTSGRRILFSPVGPYMVVPYVTPNGVTSAYCVVSLSAYNQRTSTQGWFLNNYLIGQIQTTSVSELVVYLDYKNNLSFALYKNSDNLEWVNYTKNAKGSTNLNSQNTSNYYIDIVKGYFKGYIYTFIDYAAKSSSTSTTAQYYHYTHIIPSDYYKTLTGTSNNDNMQNITATISMPKTLNNNNYLTSNVYRQPYAFPTPQETNCYGLGFSPSLRKYVR